MKLPFYFLVLCTFLFSCSSMNKIILLDKDIDKDKKMVVSEYPKHKLQEGDVLHVKVIGIQKESFDIFNIENNANNNQTTSANLFLNGFR